MQVKGTGYGGSIEGKQQQTQSCKDKGSSSVPWSPGYFASSRISATIGGIAGGKEVQHGVR